MSLDFALLDEKFEEARRLVAEAGKRNLDLADGHFLRGKLALAEDKPRQAIASYEQGLKLRPIFDEGWRQMGDIHLRLGDAEAAVNAYTTSLNQRPDNARTLNALASAQDALGQRHRALESLSTALRYAPNDAGLLNRYLGYEARHGNPDRVIAVRQEMAANNPANVTNRLALAGLFSQNDNHRQARDTLDAIEADEQVSLDADLRRQLVATRAAVTRAADDSTAGQQMIQDHLDQLGQDAVTADYLLMARYLISDNQVAAGLESYRAAVAQETANSGRPAAREYADILFNFNQTAQATEVYRDLFEQAADADARQRLGLRLAEALLRQQQTDEAEAVLNQLDPSATGQALRGVLASQQGNADQALEFINASLGRDNQNALTYFQRAALLANDPATFNQALRDTEQALQLNANLVQAMSLQANLQLRMDRAEEAARTLRRLLEVAPGNNQARLQLVQIYFQTQRPEDAADLIDQGLELEPGNPTWLMSRAQLASSRGQTEVAAQALEEVMQVSPNAQSLGQLVLIYLDQERGTAAVALLDEHPTLLSENAVLQAIRGRALVAAGQADAARRVFTLALEHSATASEVGQVVRQMVTALGSESGVALAQQVQHPENRLWVPMALASLDLSARDYLAAAARLDALRPDAASADDETRIQIEKMQAITMLQTADYRGAQQAYRRLLEVDPDNLEVLNNLAYILSSHLDDPQAAVPLAERARDLAPGSAEILDTLGWTYYQVDRLEDARRILNESVEARRLPANTYHLGRLYYERDETDRARSLLTQSRQLAQTAGDQEYLDLAQDLLRKIGE